MTTGIFAELSKKGTMDVVGWRNPRYTDASQIRPLNYKTAEAIATVSTIGGTNFVRHRPHPEV